MTELPGLMDDHDYLEPFQSVFMLSVGTGTASVTLIDNMCHSASLLSMRDLSTVFETTNNGIFLGYVTGIK